MKRLSGERPAAPDPSLVPGKYDEEGRKGLVEVDGKIIYASGEQLMEETKLFEPRFYMFRRK